MAVLLLVAVWWPRHGAAAPQKVVMGFHLAYSVNTTGQIKAIWGDLARVLEAKTGVKIEHRYYNTAEELLKALKSGDVQVGLSSEYDLFVLAHKTIGAQPVMVGAIANMKGRNPTCLFVKKASPFNRVEDLKGRKVVTYDSREDFYSLRQHLGKAPDRFFNPLNISPNGESSAYAVSLDQASGAFLSKVLVGHLIKTNPGVGRNLRPLVCLGNYPGPPLFRIRNFQGEMLDRLTQLALGAHTDPAFKRFHPLLRQMGFSFARVSAKDYQPLLNLFDQAARGQWDKEFAQWRRYAVQLKK